LANGEKQAYHVCKGLSGVMVGLKRQERDIHG